MLIKESIIHKWTSTNWIPKVTAAGKAQQEHIRAGEAHRQRFDAKAGCPAPVTLTEAMKLCDDGSLLGLHLAVSFISSRRYFQLSQPVSFRSFLTMV